MKLGDYFTETDRILSLLLIAMLSAVVGLRATFIIEYAQISVPITTVAGANALIHGLSLLEDEKQATFTAASPPPARDAHAVALYHNHPRAPQAPVLHRGRTALLPLLPPLTRHAGRREGQRAQARHDCDEGRRVVAGADLRCQHQRPRVVRLFPVQVPFARAAAQRTPHVTMTRVPQPKHGGVQLLLQRHRVPSTRHEQRCAMAAVRLRQ